MHDTEIKCNTILYTRFVYLFCKIRNSSIGIATGYGLDGRGSIPGRGREFFLHSVRTDTGAYPASCLIVTEGSFLGGKDDYSPPSSVEVRNGGNIPHPPPISIHGMVFN
jgi:hypothetical protein